MIEGYVYMMSNKKRGVIYIGSSIDMMRRGWEHRNKLIDGFTKRFNLTKLVWVKRCESVEAVRTQEQKLKNRSRARKIEIIEQNNPQWLDLYPRFFIETEFLRDPAMPLTRPAGLTE